MKLRRKTHIGHLRLQARLHMWARRRAMRDMPLFETVGYLGDAIERDIARFSPKMWATP